MRLVIQMSLEEFSQSINRISYELQVGDYAVDRDRNGCWVAYEVLRKDAGYNRNEIALGSPIPIQIV